MSKTKNQLSPQQINENRKTRVAIIKGQILALDHKLDVTKTGYEGMAFSRAVWTAERLNLYRELQRHEKLLAQGQ